MSTRRLALSRCERSLRVRRLNGAAIRRAIEYAYEYDVEPVMVEWLAQGYLPSGAVRALGRALDTPRENLDNEGRFELATWLVARDGLLGRGADVSHFGEFERVYERLLRRQEQRRRARTELERLRRLGQRLEAMGPAVQRFTRGATTLWKQQEDYLNREIHDDEILAAAIQDVIHTHAAYIAMALGMAGPDQS